MIIYPLCPILPLRVLKHFSSAVTALTEIEKKGNQQNTPWKARQPISRPQAPFTHI